MQFSSLMGCYMICVLMCYVVMQLPLGIWSGGQVLHFGGQSWGAAAPQDFYYVIQ